MSRDLPAKMTLDLRDARGDEEVADLLADHFSTAFTTESDLQEEALDFEIPSYPGDAFALDQPPSLGEVTKALFDLDIGKGADRDGLPARFFKKTSSVLLAIIYNASLASGIFPTVWKVVHIIAVHKSSLRSKVENYRQISILSCQGKVLCLLMNRHITAALGHVNSDKQHGFLQGRYTTTNLGECVTTSYEN